MDAEILPFPSIFQVHLLAFLQMFLQVIIFPCQYFQVFLKKFRVFFSVRIISFAMTIVLALSFLGILALR